MKFVYKCLSPQALTGRTETPDFQTHYLVRSTVCYNSNHWKENMYFEL